MDQQRPIRITSRSGNRSETGSHVTISGLTSGELETFEGGINGSNWFTVVEGRLTSAPVHKCFPDPIQDKEMHPHWRKPDENDLVIQESFLDSERMSEHSSPSIDIQSLCGYNYSPENYEVQAEKLISYGFAIMRSPRGSDGKFWELWHLPGLWAAKGDLAWEIEKLKNEDESRVTDLQKLNAAVKFLGNKVEFGSLNASVQRLAMVMSD